MHKTRLTTFAAVQLGCGIAVLSAGLVMGPRPARAVAASATAPASAAVPRHGAVVGRIYACSGLGVGPLYAGGSVLALRGTIRYVGSATTGRVVTPTDVVARQRVPTGGQFDFNLPPGRYVIEHHYIGGNVWTWFSVVVRSGVTLHADLPNMCK